ncbi:serine-threonine kinase receptor-associated protein [Aricia agestis]|uniref:serine-threonine kinase receptor-associated protein n=1 Tax=Aricia agestis TaxID=91739 RepID=UPI001C20582E|nr:serine-threonine kinase receptor-associated protein [Aricia agestis]XP_041978552.1 serine-threonine kinase receptor-associated protein [Aricia agestis]
MTTLKQVPLTCGGHTRPVVHLDFSDVTKDGYFLISACKDGKPMLRQGETGDWIGTFEGHKGAVWGVALTQNANLAASGAADFSAKLWDARFGEVVHTFDHEHIVKSVNFNADDNLLLTASNEKIIRVFDLNKSDAGAIEKISAHTSSIRHAVFLHNSRIASVSDDLTMRIWDRNSGQEIQKIEFPAVPNSMELSRDGAVLTVAYGTNVAFYSTDTIRKMREWAVPTKCYSASLAPARAAFVAAGEDLKVYKYDYNTGTELECNKGHFGPVHCVRWSPDGELYASGSEDGTVRLWQCVPGRAYGLWRRSADALTNGFKEVAAN